MEVTTLVAGSLLIGALALVQLLPRQARPERALTAVIGFRVLRAGA